MAASRGVGAGSKSRSVRLLSDTAVSYAPLRAVAASADALAEIWFGIDRLLCMRLSGESLDQEMINVAATENSLVVLLLWVMIVGETFLLLFWPLTVRFWRPVKKQARSTGDLFPHRDKYSAPLNFLSE